MTAALQIAEVDFHGDTVQAVQDGRGVWVPLKRVCEALGVDAKGQRTKLETKAWAVKEMISATGPDGKNYRMFCVHLKSLPMWLANIDENKVKADIKPKLQRYQIECADALAEHFTRKVTHDAALERVRVFLLEQKAPHKRTIKEKLVREIAHLYRLPYSGGRHPRWMAGVQDRIYRLVFGDEVVDELKRRNPHPRFDSNHHQHIRHRELLDQDLEVVHTIALTSRCASEFWARCAWHFRRTPMQLGF